MPEADSLLGQVISHYRILDALDAAQSRGIIHRDIKPANAISFVGPPMPKTCCSVVLVVESSRTYQVSLSGGDPVPLNSEITGGSHTSFSPSYSLFMDVVGHKALWVSPVAAGKPVKVYEFPDGESRIDYPVWSPDGKWILFDRFRPQGGDIWAIENFE